MWKKIRYGLRFAQVYIIRYKLLIVGGILIGAAVFWLYPRIEGRFFRFRGTQSIGIIGRYDQTNIPDVILDKVSIGLTQIDEQGKVYAGLSESWKAEEDGRIWIFRLDSQLTWSNGQAIKSSDITYDFEDVSITYPDDQTIQFELKDPFSPFPSVLTTPVLTADLTGIGPYKFKRIKNSGGYLKSIDLIPVGRDSAAQNLHFEFYGAEDAAKTAFKLGEVDTIYDLLSTEEFNDWPKINVSKNRQLNRYVGLFFNLCDPEKETCESREDIKEKQMRQALAYAIKDKQLGYTRVLSPIMEQSWAHNPHVKPYDYDLERAKTLLGNNQQDDSAAPIDLATVTSLLPLAEQIATDWKDLGINTQIRVVNTVPDQFDVLLVTQEVPKDPDQYVLWHSTQATNLTKYKNPKADKLLEDGRKEMDEEKRLEIYQDFQRTLLEDLPVIFLFQPVTYSIGRG